jgi:hypothetical protein
MKTRIAPYPNTVKKMLHNCAGARKRGLGNNSSFPCLPAWARKQNVFSSVSKESDAKALTPLPKNQTIAVNLAAKAQ